MNHERYEAVIGLEVHAQLLTNSKLFCGDSASFGGEPNTHISPITLAHPGTLPKMNREAVEYALRLGLALNCQIEQHNYFARKNYFYPDLPKGYQISQHTTPICKNGGVPIQVGDASRIIRLNRIHMEEDAGKSLHDIDPDYTSIDLNRAGVPLLEIVSEPDLHSSDEAFAYLTALRKLVRWLGICDGNMEEGSLRCDANISIRPRGDKKLGTRVEVKNLNSIRNVKRAIEVELNRLVELTEKGEPILQETRSYDADNNSTFTLRSKEEADDYRYFPDPDLTPFHITDAYLQQVKEALPALPEQLELHYVNEYGLPMYDARFICSDKATVEYFESVIRHQKHCKAVANWLMGPVKSWLNEHQADMEKFPLLPEKLAELVQLVEDGRVNFNIASTRIFPALLQDGAQSALDAATRLNLLQESSTDALAAWVDEALAAMPDKVEEYRKGKKGLIGLFAGEVKKRSKGKADMQQVNRLLAEKLG